MSRRAGTDTLGQGPRQVLRVAIAVALTSLITTAPAASAASWERSFDPIALGQLAIPGRTRVALVAAGEPTPELVRARGMLAAAAGASGRWTVVDPDPDLEIDPEARDAALVEQQREGRDVEAVWVLRLFPSTSVGAPATATVMMYSPIGPLLGNFYVIEGEPLQVVATPPDLAAEYLRQRISPVTADTIVTSPEPESFAREGGFAKDGVHLREPRDLYLAMGRHDLVQRYDDTDADRLLASVISGGVAFIGVVVFMHDVFDAGGIPTTDIGAAGISGLVLAGLGTAGVVIAQTTIDPDPLDWDGKVAAVAAYNDALRRRLELPTQGRVEVHDRGPRLSRIGVAPLRDGLGLSLGGQF